MTVTTPDSFLNSFVTPDTLSVLGFSTLSLAEKHSRVINLGQKNRKLITSQPGYNEEGRPPPLQWRQTMEPLVELHGRAEAGLKAVGPGHCDEEYQLLLLYSSMRQINLALLW